MLPSFSSVITIIVLLILAGVSIAMLTGENGILTQAQNARENTTKAEEEEKIKMAVLGSSLTDNEYADILDTDSLTSELTNQFGAGKFQLDANKGGSFLITINDTQREYYVSIDKTIINNDNILKINNEEELKAFRDDVNSGNTYVGKVVLLTKNMDLQGEEWKPIGYYSNESSSPDSDLNKPFKGIFDGFGNEVDNFTINTTNKSQGLFGLIDNSNVVNVGVGEKVRISGVFGGAGLIGYAYNGTKVYNCYNNATIEGTTSIGGIVGVLYSNSSVINCYNSGSVIITGKEVDKFLGGGVVGNCDTSAQILNCYNKGNVEGILPGGIAGQVVKGSTIENCYNVGNITKTEGNTSLSYIHYSIVGKLGLSSVDSDNVVRNCYYLNGTVNGGNDIDEFEGVVNKSPEELKALSGVLGNAFKEDESSINNGYPILYWQ